VTNHDRPELCDKCKWFDPLEHPKEEGCVQLGKCRRRAPSILVGVSKYLMLANACIPGKESEDAVDYREADSVVWPMVRDWDFCGEFAPTEQETAT
jgi:hypothetical protein